MSSSFESHIQTLESRWRSALDAAGYDTAVIEAGVPENYYQDDHAPPFRANPDFAQWLPADAHPGAVIVVHQNAPTQLLLHAPEDYWHAPSPKPNWAAGAMDIASFETFEALDTALAGSIKGGKRVLLAAEGERSNLGAHGHNDDRVLAPIRFQRGDKTPWEMAQLRAASVMGVKGHIAAEEAFLAGGSEFEINLAFLGASQQAAEDLPYHSIVALNEHAAVLHYQHYDRARPSQHRSFLIDAGGRVNGYASDITRTYAFADGAFQDMVNRFDAHQQALIASIVPGMSYLSLHEQAHRLVGETLAEFGLVSCSAEAAFESGITQTFLPHGLGHLLGIQVHDIGGHQVTEDGDLEAPPAAYPSLRLTRTVAPGQVFTIEPGLYFIPMLLDALRASDAASDVVWSAVEQFAPYGGIRIEDDVHVLDSGVENLTRNAYAEVRGD